MYPFSDNQHHSLVPETGAVTNKALPHLPQSFYLYEKILALIKQLPAVSLVIRDEYRKAISELSLDGANSQTVSDSRFVRTRRPLSAMTTSRSLSLLDRNYLEA